MVSPAVEQCGRLRKMILCDRFCGAWRIRLNGSPVRGSQSRGSPMKGLLLCYVLLVSTALFAAENEPTPQNPSDPVGKKANPKANQQGELSGVVRFLPNPTPLTGASGDVYAVAISPDGKRVANVGGTFLPAAGFVAVLDVETKKELWELRLPQVGFTVAYSPNGTYLVVSLRDGGVRLLQADTGKQVFALRLGSPTHVCFAPDSKTIATVTATRNVQIWDVPSGEERAKLRGATGQLTSVAFSQDGKRLAAGGVDGNPERVGKAFVWDVATERLLTKVDVPDTPTFAIAFSPDNQFLATGGPDGLARQWELPGGKQKNAIRAKGSVLSLAYSSGRRILAAGTDTGSIVLLDPESAEEIGRLLGHTGMCRALAFSDDGKRLVSGGVNRTVKEWDVSAKKELTTLRQDEAPRELPAPLAIAATPDGSLVAVATEEGVILRDGRTGEPRGRFAGHEDAVTCVAFSRDGKTLATGSADKTIKLWDIATAKVTFTLKGHTNWVYAAAFSPDGKTLATGGYDKTVRLWDTTTGKEIASFEAHRGSVRAVAFSPDGKSLATGGSDRTVKVWDSGTRVLRHTLKSHRGSVRAVAFSPDGKTLASGGEDNTLYLWDPVAGKELLPLAGHTDEVVCVAFADLHTVVSGGADGTIRVWQVTKGVAAAVMPAHPGGVTGLAVLQGGAGLLSGGQDKTLKRWRPDIPGPVRIFIGHTGVVQSARFSPDGKRFASCGNWPEGDKTIRVWDVETGNEILKIDQPGQTSMAIFSPDGKHILSTCDNHDVHLWDATTGKELQRFEGHTNCVNGISFSANGKRMLSSGVDGTVRYWNVETGRELQKFEGHNATVRRVVFHPDGKHALSAGRDGRVRMWELDTAKEVKQFAATGNWADCLGVTKDGKYVAVGGTTVRVYEIETEKQVSECVGHMFGVTHVTFSPDGKQLLTASYDGTARLWDRETGKELYRFRGHRDFVWSAEFSPDSKWILTSCGGNANGGKFQKGTDFTIRLWAMPDERMMAEFGPEN